MTIDERLTRRHLRTVVRCFFPPKRGGESHEGGQGLLIVLGLVTMIFLGTMAVVSNVFQHNPIVNRDEVVHESYRAMQAGVNNYLSMANSNPDTVICSATVKTVNSYPNPTTTSTSQPSLPSGSQICSGFSTGSWTSVQNLSTVSGVSAWYLYGSPTIYYCTGTGSSCPGQVWVSLQVVGASISGSVTSYTPGTVTFQPQNGFLLNLLWLNYDQEDPSTTSATTCTWYSGSLGKNCVPVDLVGGESLNGSIFSNDPVFICSSGSGASNEPTVSGSITSHYSSAILSDPTSGSCGSSVLGSPTLTANAPFEQVPTDDAVLAAQAAANGCLYEGPTEIYLQKVTSGGVTSYQMGVTSPDTPTSGAYGTTNDALDDNGNASTCVPSTNRGDVPYPKNGVVFVENCVSTNTLCTAASAFNPVDQGGTQANDLYQPDDQESGWSGPQGYKASVSPATLGDALVQGTEQGPLTIAAQDNVVITGNLCYASWTTNNGVQCDQAPTGATSDVLGLIAYNYVVVNHPVSVPSGYSQSSSDDSTCTSNLATYGSTTSNSGLECDLQNPVIDATILALNQQYFVSNWDQGNQLGNIYVNGSVSEDWRGPVGTTSPTGYTKIYTYDQRLQYLSPPDYLNPGTSSWTIGTISAVTGTCPVAVTGCSTKP